MHTYTRTRKEKKQCCCCQRMVEVAKNLSQCFTQIAWEKSILFGLAVNCSYLIFSSLIIHKYGLRYRFVNNGKFYDRHLKLINCERLLINLILRKLNILYDWLPIK